MQWLGFVIVLGVIVFCVYQIYSIIIFMIDKKRNKKKCDNVEIEKSDIEEQ